MTTISNCGVAGVWDMSGAAGVSYFRELRVGAGTPGTANATGDLYVTNRLELDGDFYHDGAGTIHGVAHTEVIASGVANARTVGRNATSAWTRYDTLNDEFEVYKKLEYNAASGIQNRALAGLDQLATRQGDWFRYNLGSANGAAAMLSAPNPYSGTACIITDWFLRVEKVASGCSHIEAGITSGVSTVGDLMKSGPITAAGAFARTRTTQQGGSGNSGMPVVWGANNKLNVTASGGHAAGASNFSGHLFVCCKKVD